jgi:hypothetical protein
VSTTGWWILGFAVAGVVVLIAASLLIAIILLARRIASQTAAITFALDGAMRNTNPLFDLASVNHGLEAITRGVAKLRGHSKGLEDERNLLERMRSKLPGRGP